MTDDLIFLFDVDNTLLDNDEVQADLRDYLAREHGPASRDRYWELFEELRGELGYADYLGALERFRVEEMHDPRVLRMANWLIDYPFASRLYPGALEVVRHVQQWGRAVDPVGRRRGVPAAQGAARRTVGRGRRPRC